MNYDKINSCTTSCISSIRNIIDDNEVRVVDGKVVMTAMIVNMNIGQRVGK